MSLQRAGINCERCYFEGIQEQRFSEDRKDVFRRIYPFRNEAMLALEGVLKESAYLENGENKKLCANAQQALYLCSRCDLKEPRVLNLINRLEKESEIAEDKLGD